MSLAGKLVSEIPIRVPAKLVSEIPIRVPARKFFKILREEIFHIPKICPKFIKKIEIEEGDWSKHCHGSIKTWYYTVDGKDEVYKERVEYDDEKLIIKLIGLEGDVFKEFKVINSSIHVVPKGPEQSLTIVTMEYEKVDAKTPCPYKYLDILYNMVHDIESHVKE